MTDTPTQDTTRATYSRETTRTVSLNGIPELDHVRIAKPYDTAQRGYRPASITERLRQYPDAGEIYTVQVFGPVVTTKGADHASQRGDRTWSTAQLAGKVETRWGDVPFPDELRPYLVGPDALRGWSR